MGKKKQRFKSFLKWSAITLVTTGTIGALGGFLYVNNKLSTLPDIDTQYLTTYGNSKIVDADGNIIWQTTQTYSKSTTFEEIEPTLIDDAIINVEDEDFYKNNPKLSKIIVEALNEANKFIKENEDEAIKLYLSTTKSNESPEIIAKVLKNTTVYDTKPKANITQFSDFLYDIGAIKQKPKDWKELFFDAVK